MAKQAKVVAKRAKPAVKKVTVSPTYLRGTKHVDIPVHRIVDVLNMIEAHGHTKKFRTRAKAADVTMRLHPATVNFVKDFVANNDMHAHPVGKQVINSGGTYDCTSK
jgi:hypothetical protein